MKTVFGVDASQQKGACHVMRCLTLAEALMAEWGECRFLACECPDNLLESMPNKGKLVLSLRAPLLSEMSSRVIEAAANITAPADAAWPVSQRAPHFSQHACNAPSSRPGCLRQPTDAWSR